jgi:hypothetical protein
MLLPPTSQSSRAGRSSRFGRQRRHIRKLAVVCRILGALCVVAAIALFVSSLFATGGMQAKKVALRQLKVSAVFIAAAPTLLLIGVGLNWWKYRFYGRGQRRRPPEGQGHDRGKGAPRATDLPTS